MKTELESARSECRIWYGYIPFVIPNSSLRAAQICYGGKAVERFFSLQDLARSSSWPCSTVIGSCRRAKSNLTGPLGEGSNLHMGTTGR